MRRRSRYAPGYGSPPSRFSAHCSRSAARGRCGTWPEDSRFCSSPAGSSSPSASPPSSSSRWSRCGAPIDGTNGWPRPSPTRTWTDEAAGHRLRPRLCFRRGRGPGVPARAGRASSAVRRARVGGAQDARSDAARARRVEPRPRAQGGDPELSVPRSVVRRAQAARGNHLRPRRDRPEPPHHLRDRSEAGRDAARAPGDGVPRAARRRDPRAAVPGAVRGKEAPGSAGGREGHRRDLGGDDLLELRSVRGAEGARPFGPLATPGHEQVILLAVLAVASSPCDELAVRRMKPMMATLVTVTVRGCDAAALELRVREAFEEMERLAGILSEWDPHSAVSRVNDNAGIAPVEIPHELEEVL